MKWSLQLSACQEHMHIPIRTDDDRQSLPPPLFIIYYLLSLLLLLELHASYSLLLRPFPRKPQTSAPSTQSHMGFSPKSLLLINNIIHSWRRPVHLAFRCSRNRAKAWNSHASTARGTLSRSDLLCSWSSPGSSRAWHKDSCRAIAPVMKPYHRLHSPPSHY